MEIRRLTHFVAVARELHFRRAAESLHIAQSALSHSVKTLERDLGVELLHRTTRRVELTSAGEVLLEEAESILWRIGEARRRVRLAGDGQIGHLTVGFAGSATYELMPRVAMAFRSTHPEVGLDLHGEMVTRTQVEELIKGRIDVGLLRQPVGSHELELRPLRTDTLIAVLPTDHRLHTAASIHLEDLRDDAFVSYAAGAGASVHSVFISACVSAGFTPRIAQQAQETHTLVSLVAAGIGVALLPAPVRHLQIPGVEYRDLDGSPPSSDLVIAWRRGDRSAALHAFVAVAEAVAHRDA